MHQPANIGLRFLALVIDFVLVSILRTVVSLALTLAGILRDISPDQQKVLQEMAANQATPEEIFGATIRFLYESGQMHFSAVFAIMTIVGYAVFISTKGGTPGKLALGLRIIDTATGGAPSFGRALARESIAKFLSSATIVGGLLPFFRSDSKALHDIFSRTQVVAK